MVHERRGLGKRLSDFITRHQNQGMEPKSNLKQEPKTNFTCMSEDLVVPGALND